MMKNLARSNPTPTDIDAVTAICRSELEAAGIKVTEFDIFASRGEVPSRAIGEVASWGFRRAWYYWVAEGPGIPLEIAEKLHATHGKDVRVAGHCGCPSPREWFKGFGVGSYHVDTQEGLNALAAAIMSVGAASGDDDNLRQALKTAVDHIEHMAAWITKQNAGYSFESLGEDLPGIRAALGKPAE